MYVRFVIFRDRRAKVGLACFGQPFFRAEGSPKLPDAVTIYVRVLQYFWWYTYFAVFDVCTSMGLVTDVR